MAQKLIKVAKEFNVGLHTIVETLHSKGFPIEEKPTADISDEMLIVLQKEFQKDLAIKQEADKLARPVLKKDPVSPGAGAPATTTTTAPPPAARPSLLPPREEAPKVALPKIEEAREVKPAAQKEEPEVMQRERPALRVIGRIDLDAANKTQAPKPEEKKPAAPAPPPAEPVTPPAPEPEKPVAAPVQEQKPAAEKPAPEPPKPADKPAPTDNAAGTSTVPEESEMYRADAPQLRGLKILGRISLDKPKPEPSSGNRNQQGGGNRNQLDRGEGYQPARRACKAVLVRAPNRVHQWPAGESAEARTRQSLATGGPSYQ